MNIIPLNNETMRFSQEAFIESQKRNVEERERRRKAEEKYEEFKKKVKPFEDKINELRKEELIRLLKTKKFNEKIKIYDTGGYLSKDYHIRKDVGRCGYEEVDLVYEYGSKRYKKEINDLLIKIRNI